MGATHLAVETAMQSWFGVPKLSFVCRVELSSKGLALCRSFLSDPPWLTNVSWTLSNSGACWQENELGTVEELTLVQNLEMSKEAVISSGLQLDSGNISLNLTNKERKNEGRVLEYSQQLEGISLEDFFLGKMQLQEVAHSGSLTVTNVQAAQTVNALNLGDTNEHNESLLLDPLMDSIPSHTVFDGRCVVGHLGSLSAHFPSNQQDGDVSDIWISAGTFENMPDNPQMERQSQEEAEDDSFSWEGEFQSAAPVTQSSILESQQLEDLWFQSNEQKAGSELEPEHVTEAVKDKLDFNIQGKSSDFTNSNAQLPTMLSMNQDDQFWIDASSIPAPSERSPDTVIENVTDFDDLFFGSSWQQNAPSEPLGGNALLVRRDAAVGNVTSLDNFAGSDFEWTETDMQLGLSGHRTSSQTGSIPKQLFTLEEPEVPALHDTNMINSGSALSNNSKQEVFQIEQPDSHVLTNQQQNEKESKTVESLVAQLHDLSFMLADSVRVTDVKDKK